MSLKELEAVVLSHLRDGVPVDAYQPVAGFQPDSVGPGGLEDGPDWKSAFLLLQGSELQAELVGVPTDAHGEPAFLRSRAAPFGPVAILGDSLL